MFVISLGPSKAPSFWYKIEPSHTHGYRSVQLMWKVKKKKSPIYCLLSHINVFYMMSGV